MPSPLPEFLLFYIFPCNPPLNLIIIFNSILKLLIAAFFASAEKVELPLNLKGLEPIPDPCFPVRMPAKLTLFERVVYLIDNLVFTCAKHLYIIAIMRAVICNHRHHNAFNGLVCVQFYNGIVDDKVRYPLPCCKTIWVILCCPYVALKMDIRFSPRFHNPLWLHLNGLQIDRCYFHAINGLRYAYWCLQGKYRRIE